MRTAWPAAQWTWTHNHPAGRGSDTLPGGNRLFLPLQTGRGIVGVIGVERADAPLLTPDERRLLSALLDQAAVAIERVHLADDVDAVRLQAETERLRNALLTSISHDLRTPLASILGAITSLRSYGPLYAGPQREDLLITAQEETERLNRFVGNPFGYDHRLKRAASPCYAEAVDIVDIIGAALRRAAPTSGSSSGAHRTGRYAAAYKR